MKPVCDYVLVRVDSTFNDKLFIKGEGGKEVELVLNTKFNPTHNVRICAEVISEPQYLSGRDVAYERYVGLPRPLAYRGHDYISKAMAQLPERYRNLKDKQIPYQCGTFEPEMVPLELVDVLPGDVIYFHYNKLLDESNFVEKEESGSLIYRVPYPAIFCRVRNEEIAMLNAYVLVSALYDGDVEDIRVDGAVVNKGKIKNGLVTELEAKPKYLKGKLEYIGHCVGPDTRKIPQGEIILFRPGSEFKNNIEGQEYYVMKQWDIVAKVLSDEEIAKFRKILGQYSDHYEYLTMRPVGDYVMIRPEELPVTKFAEVVVYDPREKEQGFKPGQLFVLDGTLHKTKKKGTQYGVGRAICAGENSTSPIGLKMYFGKSSFYIYLEEENLAFIRHSDIFGWMD